MCEINYKKAGLYYTIGSFFNKGIAFFTVPIFTRLLSTADYGTASTYNSWVSMVSVCIGFTLYMAIRQAFIDYPKQIDEFNSTVTIFITMVSGMILLICLAVGTFTDIDVMLPMLCIIQSYASALIEDYSMYLMMQYRYKVRTAFMVLPNLISVIIATLVIKFLVTDRMYFGKILPTAIITAVFGVIVIVSVFRKSRKFNKSLLKYGLAISVPLIAHGVALTLLAQSDRTMITMLVGAEKTGVYSVVYNFSMIATALTTALSGIWQPWYLTRLKNHTDMDFEEINNMTQVYVMFMSVVMCGVILAAPEVLKFLASKPYWEGVSIIPPIVLANLVTFVYTFYVDVEHFHKKTKFIAFNTMVAAVSNVILNYIFIPICGYEAAAYTTIVSYAISLVLHYMIAKKLEAQSAGLFTYAKQFLLVIAVSVFYYVFIENWILRWGVAIALGITTLAYLYRKLGKKRVQR